MTTALHHRLRFWTARILCALMLVQVLIPAGLTPARPVMAGADGSLLPTIFCAAARAAGEGKSARDGADHRHCVLCRLPALAGLGTGIVVAPALPVPSSWERVRRRASAGPAVAVDPVQGFHARAPPSFPSA